MYKKRQIDLKEAVFRMLAEMHGSGEIFHSILTEAGSRFMILFKKF